MDPVTIAALVGAGTTVGSSALSAWSNAASQRDTNTANANMNEQQMMFNANESRLARNYEERMSNSAWQRGVADMKLAGINPMAAFSSGGASTPSASGATTGSQRSMDNVPAIPASVLTTALEVARTFSEMNKNKATTINIAKDTDVKDSEIERNLQDALHSTMQSREIDAWLPSIRSTAFSDVNRINFERNWPRSFGFTDAILRRLGIVGTAAKAAVAYKLLKRP